MTYDDAKIGRVQRLSETIQAAIFAASDPQERVLTENGTQGAMVAVDTADVMEALCWAAASIAVQSGEVPTLRHRKAAAKELGRLFLKFCPVVEEAIAALGRPSPLRPN
jgi:hypothetical protein